MNQPRFAFSLALAAFAPSLFAQDHTITIKPQGDSPTRYTIESSSKIETNRKMLVNGEEGGFGGGRGGGGRGGQGAQGPVSSMSKFVFVDGGSWRQYETAEAKVARPSVDGETNEQTVTGDLQGKKVNLGAEPAIVDGDKTTPLQGQAARGLPRKIDFSGLAPSKPLALNGTYEIGNPFKAALAGLSHPLNVQGGQGGGDAAGRRNRGGGEGGDAAGGGRRNRGGEGGGDAAGGGEGRRAGGGQGRGGMGRMGGELNLMQVLASEGATPKLTGKLVKVENGIATIEISGDVVGEGAADKLGLGGGLGGMMRGGRGRGGEGGEGGQAPQAESKANVKIAVKGTMTVDVAAGALQSLNLSGKVDTNDTSKMTRESPDGETMEIESTATRKGEFSVSVTTAAAK